VLLEYSPSSKLLSVARTRNANELGLNMKTTKCINVTEYDAATSDFSRRFGGT
jgi:hypothetical protein